jgi:hypothetical protein
LLEHIGKSIETLKSNPPTTPATTQMQGQIKTGPSKFFVSLFVFRRYFVILFGIVVVFLPVYSLFIPLIFLFSWHLFI